MQAWLASPTLPRRTFSSLSSFLQKNLWGRCIWICAILLLALPLLGKVEASSQLLEDERSAPDYYDRVYEAAARNKLNEKEEDGDGLGDESSITILAVQSAPEDRNESNVLVVDVRNGDDDSGNGNTTTYRMAHIATFIPFSNGTFVRAGIHNDAASVLLAIKHFNSYLDEGRSAEPANGTAASSEKRSILDSVGLDRNCNVRLTTELFDSRLDPIVSTSILADDVLKRKHKPAAVLGAYRSG